MQSQRWLESVREQLVARRLQRDYIERFVDELADHFHDLTEESMKSEQEAILRLGEPTQVAKAAARAYHRRTFLGRHPVVAFLTFGISPFFVLAIVFIAEILLVCKICDHFGDGYFFPRRVRYLGWSRTGLELAFSFAFLIAPTILLIAFYQRLAKHTFAARRWIALSCVGMLVIAFFTHFSVGFAWKGHQSYLGIYLSRSPGLLQYVQCAVPIALCCWLVWKHRKSQLAEARVEKSQGSEHVRAVA